MQLDWWDRKTNGQKLTVVIVILAVVFFLFWNPMTRSIILWVLPLGSGMDDLVFIASGIFLGVFLIWKMRERSR